MSTFKNTKDRLRARAEEAERHVIEAVNQIQKLKARVVEYERLYDEALDKLAQYEPQESE